MKRNPARWRTLEARLGREFTIWIATVRNDGRPHMTPVWYVWLEGRIYVAIGTESQKFVNLRGNQLVSLALPDTENVIILEGEAHAADRPTSDKIADYFFHKYEWDFRYDDSSNWRLIEITPNKILTWGDGYEGEGIRIL
jgi:general stress protein 26